MKNVLITLIFCLPVMALGQNGASFNEDLAGMLAFNEQRILQLAEAIPADKYGWRPAEGVRSVSESLQHMASANYFFMMKMGFDVPEGVDMQNMESVTDKDKVIESVKNSFAFCRENLGKVEDLDTKVEFPFGEMNKRSALLVLLEHSGEHKGQLIAYARMNGIKPPWSE